MIYLAIGRRGQGKTTLALYLARKSARRVLFDPRGLIQDTRGHAIRTSHSTQIQQGIDAVINGEVPEVIITPTLQVQPAFDTVMRELHEWLRVDPMASFTLLIDELRFVRDLDTPHFEWLLRCSRPDRVNIILTCHRPADIPTDIRAIADTWLIFRVTQEHDLKVIESRSPAVARAVRHLESREFIAWDDAAGEHTAYKRPEAWYVPLGSTVQALGDTEHSLGLEPALDSTKLPLV